MNSKTLRRDICVKVCGREAMMQEKSKEQGNGQKLGYNLLDKEEQKSMLSCFVEQLCDPLIFILFAAAAISLLLREYGDMCIILAVVLLNAVVGVIQEGKAKRALEALEKMTSPHALIHDEDGIREIPAADLIPGDIVCLEAGRQVPADIRIISAVNLNRGVGADGRICPGLKKYDRSERGIYDHKCHIRPWGGDRHCNRDGYENRRYRKIAFRDKNGTDTAAEKTCGSWENSWYSFRFFVYPAVCDGGFAETQCRRNADHRDITGGRSSPGRTAGDRYDGTGTFGITHGKGQYDCEKTAECGNLRLCECGMFG